MKNLIYIFAVLALLVVSSCSKNIENNQAEDITDILLTVEDVNNLVAYEPFASREITHQKSIVRYDSQPIGQDPVILEVYSYNANRSIAQVYELFKQRKEKRPQSVDVEDLGIEAFIAYPSIILYRDGYMMIVTAGSGAEDEQTELLKKAGKIVADHLEEYLQEHPTDNDLLASE